MLGRRTETFQKPDYFNFRGEMYLDLGKAQAGIGEQFPRNYFQ